MTRRQKFGGAQQLFGVKPHLTTLAKALGNGYPISTVCGLEEIMKKYATQKVVPQSTYARNLVSLAAADATLDKIKTGRKRRRRMRISFDNVETLNSHQRFERSEPGYTGYVAGVD